MNWLFAISFLVGMSCVGQTLEVINLSGVPVISGTHSNVWPLGVTQVDISSGGDSSYDMTGGIAINGTSDWEIIFENANGDVTSRTFSTGTIMSQHRQDWSVAFVSGLTIGGGLLIFGWKMRTVRQIGSDGSHF